MALQNPEAAVRSRYSEGAAERQPSLCCATTYDPQYLEVLPAEVIEKDYGCGDPTPYVREGDTVVDLGSGSGKICWIAAQIAGPKGRVFGIDMNPDMLELARRHHATVTERIGYDTVQFKRAMIQDLALDLDALDAQLQESPVQGADAWLDLRAAEDRLRTQTPLIASDSVDVILSNCVLNLVQPKDKAQLFDEMYRVLKNGGRVAISDIVSDEDIPLEMQNDPELWSGCISGAYREDLFLKAFADAGFHGIEIVHRDPDPWQTVQGIEFRSVTVQAFKGKEGPCLERNQAVIYNGPFREVHDDDGHVYYRGERMAVCDKTFHLLQRAPYQGMFTPISPREEIPLESAGDFACRGAERRDPRVTKGQDYDATTDASDCCAPAEDTNGCC